MIKIIVPIISLDSVSMIKNGVSGTLCDDQKQKQKSTQVALLLLLAISVLLSLVSCGDSDERNGQTTSTPTNTPSLAVENTVTLSYTLPIIPVTLAIDNHGHISIGLGIKITTLIGEFVVSASSAITNTPVSDNALLLVIRHHKDSHLVDSNFRINTGQGVGNADIKGHINEVKIGWNRKSNSVFIDASNGDISSIIIQGTPATPTTTVLTPTVTLSPTSIPTQERLSVYFRKNATCGTLSTGVKTKNGYRGSITLMVSGTGKALGTQQSDAFYIFTDGRGKSITPIHRDSIGAILFINNQPADSFINGSIPPFNPSHTYTFRINAPGGQLTFSVGDCKTNNNSGNYIITISSIT